MKLVVQPRRIEGWFSPESVEKVMSVSEVSSHDGVVFARSIRELARRAHARLQRPTSDREVQDLIDQIEDLELEVMAHGSEELSRWLASLRRIVEEQMMAPI
jgi:hypothetical protein